MSYAYNSQDARRQRLRSAIRDERRLHDVIKSLDELRDKLHKGVLRQLRAKEIVEARDALKRVRRLLDLLNALCTQVPALNLLRGEHYGLMCYIVHLQEELKLPAAERIHFELRGKPLTNSPFDEDEPQDASEQT